MGLNCIHLDPETIQSSP